MINRTALVMGAHGFALGFALSCIGFADWGEVHRMFTLVDLRLLFTFVGAVGLTAAGFAIVGRGRALGSRPLQRGTVVGGVLFGVGWAISGACPGASLVQLGEGRVAALVTIAGIVVGVRLHAVARARWFTWDHGGCES
jgi:uncharacterized membrane protein YedE/YeeE